jgi:C-terminal processing protease CtpA/Prc
LLVTNPVASDAPAATPLVSKARVFDGDIAYVRIAGVSGGLAEEVSDVHRLLGSSNALEGVVLDLRYTDGGDYAAAAATADLFTAKSQLLLNWGAGVVSSHQKADAIPVPVAVLVNRETAGAAEALAAVLRETGVGLILGGRTAGRAMITQDFPLSNGDQLRIPVTPVTLGDGSALSARGIKPDIDVTVSAENERAYYADAYLALLKTNLVAGGKLAALTGPDGTNPAARRSRMNEAELVREHKEGLESDPDGPLPPGRQSEPPKPVVNDPVLARALDLLRGLAVVRQDHL